MKFSKDYYKFTLQLENVDDITDEMEDALFEAGCDDALLYSSKSNIYLDFDREEVSFDRAVDSARSAIKAAGYECKLLENSHDL